MSTDNTAHGGESSTMDVTVTVNGEEVTREVQPRLKLSDFLRRECGLRGVRVGCEHGVCGACTVHLDGRGVKSCLVYAVQADGRSVETVEALSADGSLHPIQRAFHETHALQCGFCTSGFVMATKELLAENPDPSREEIEHGLADNICRCTGYQNIYDAVERAADAMDGAGSGEAGDAGSGKASDGGSDEADDDNDEAADGGSADAGDSDGHEAGADDATPGEGE